MSQLISCNELNLKFFWLNLRLIFYVASLFLAVSLRRYYIEETKRPVVSLEIFSSKRAVLRSLLLINWPYSNGQVQNCPQNLNNIEVRWLWWRNHYVGAVPDQPGLHNARPMFWVIVLVEPKSFPYTQFFGALEQIFLNNWRYMFLSIMPSIKTRFPTPEAAMQVQAITLPPPCFTVGFKYFFEAPYLAFAKHSALLPGKF